MGRVSVLIGAGAVHDASREIMGIPASTAEITRSLHERFGYSLTGHIQQARICKSVIDLSGGQGRELNFEDVYHLMHQTLICCENDRPDEVDGRVSDAMRSCGIDVDSPECVAMAARECMDHIINAIVRTIEGYNLESGHRRAPPEWFGNFFRTVSEATNGGLDICNLNYDSWIEDCINCDEGFSDYRTPSEFRTYPAPFIRTHFLNPGRENRMMHVHGCLWYYYHGSGLAKFDYPHLIQTSGDHIVFDSGKVLSPVVTGREKDVNNLVFEPFSTYLDIVEHRMVLNDILIIIGYGFGDDHINRMVHGFHNGSGKDLVIIGPSSDNLNSAIEEVCGYRLSENGIIRENGDCLWYAGGFRDAVGDESFMEKLIELLRRHSI